jgi:hypothetical protein
MENPEIRIKKMQVPRYLNRLEKIGVFEVSPTTKMI